MKYNFGSLIVKWFQMISSDYFCMYVCMYVCNIQYRENNSLLSTNLASTLANYSSLPMQ